MAKVTCAISGISFSCEYMPGLSLSNAAGFVHPIFAASQETLYRLYTKHCNRELTCNDSYLLFTAFLHSTDQITWKAPATCKPTDSRTVKLIENNISQLLSVIEKSNCIKHPRFSQPAFIVNYDNSKLEQIPHWIKAWEENIATFNSGLRSMKLAEDLQKVENKLTKLIISGEDTAKYAAVVANWASKAAEFPADKDELWQRTIRSCFSITKMFNTPLALLKEIKEHCECNIEPGSIHFHTLYKVLNEGIAKHLDYLGGSSLALGYTILPSLDLEAKASIAKNQSEVEAIVAKAPATEPKREDYASSTEFIRAKLAYRIASRASAKNLNNTGDL